MFLSISMAISLSFAQSTIDTKIDSLKDLKEKSTIERNRLDKRIKELDKKIDSLDKEKIKLELASQTISYIINTKNDGRIWEGAAVSSNYRNFPENAKIKIYPKWRDDGRYIRAEYKNKPGWIRSSYVDRSSIPKKFETAWNIYSDTIKKGQNSYKTSDRNRRVSKRTSNRKKYGSKIANAIFDRSVVIGMTYQQVIESIGRPSDTNRTTTAYGTSTQLVYTNNRKIKYVYLENGIVTAFQD